MRRNFEAHILDARNGIVAIMTSAETQAHDLSEDDTVPPDDVLDATGLSCPLPVLKTRKRLKGMASGSVLEVLATDPASFVDIPHFCNVSGNDLLDWGEDAGTFFYRIRKAAD